MDRKKFLKKMGGGAIATLMIGCCASCTKMDNPKSPVESINFPEPTDVDFTIDLTDSSTSNLQNPGGYVKVDSEGNVTESGIHVVALSIDGEYIAATRLCSHEALYKIEYMQEYNSWVCDEHGAAFDLQGNGNDAIFPNVEDPSVNNNGLTVYNTELINPDTLRVFS